MMYVLQNKETKMFYNIYKCLVKDIKQARFFKTKASLFSFFRCNKEIMIFEKRNRYPRNYSINDFDIIGVKLVITSVQKKITEEYKTKQLITEIEK